MGSWHGTCGISQMPIISGTKVKAYLLLQSAFEKQVSGRGTCYCTNYFRPWFLPVTAYYNDYGSIEYITDDWHTKYMLATFQKWLATGTIVIAKDYPCTQFQSLDQVFDCVERGALTYNKSLCSFPAPFEIGLFLIIDSVFCNLVAETKTFTQDDRSQQNMEQQKVRDIIDSVRKSKKPVDLDIDTDHLLMFGGLTEARCAYKHYRSIIYRPNAVDLPDIFSRLDDTVAISMAMDYLRKLWFPQTCQGSQSAEFNFHKRLIKSMNQYIKQRKLELAE